MDTLHLQSNVYEDSFISFVESLSQAKIAQCVDFRNMRYYIPAAITALLCSLKSPYSSIKRATINTECNSFKYLQRMDFFKYLKFENEIPEKFTRHQSNNFSPIIKITKDSNEQDISNTINSTILGSSKFEESTKDNIAKIIQYAIGELVRNVIQHSEGIGYIASQYYPKSDFIRIGISDGGIGILESFKKSNSPHYKEYDTHISILKKALENQISSKTHLPLPPYSTGHTNQGVGLTMLREIIKTIFGHFILLSGNAMIYQDGNNTIEKELNGFYNGTICSIALPRYHIEKYTYSELRKEIFDNVNKKPLTGPDNNVESIFL